jgi:hypothetical protein
MVCAGYVVELLFGAAGLIPSERNAMVMEAAISWNYTTWLNIALLLLAAVFVLRFLRTGGISMLRMMGGSPDTDDDRTHDPGHHQDHGGDHRGGNAPSGDLKQPEAG